MSFKHVLKGLDTLVDLNLCIKVQSKSCCQNIMQDNVISMHVFLRRDWIMLDIVIKLLYSKGQKFSYKNQNYSESLNISLWEIFLFHISFFDISKTCQIQ